jgi:hypothetical protein
MISITPDADHPIPFDMSEELPKTHADSVAIAANTIDMLEQLGGSFDYSSDDFQKAASLVKGQTTTPQPKNVTSTGTAKVLAIAVKENDFQVFADIQQARNFVTNRLVSLANCGDIKVELKALELLGKHSDIGLFTERSEITVHHTTSTSLENSIKERVKRLLNTEYVDTIPLDDLDEQLGPITEPGTFAESNTETLDTVEDTDTTRTNE